MHADNYRKQSRGSVSKSLGAMMGYRCAENTKTVRDGRVGNERSS